MSNHRNAVVQRSRKLQNCPHIIPLSLSKAFSASSEKTHKGCGGVRKSQEYEGVDAYCQMHAPLDETGLVLLDQTMNYLLHTRSKNFSIDFRSHGISAIGSVAELAQSNGYFPF